MKLMRKCCCCCSRPNRSNKENKSTQVVSNKRATLNIVHLANPVDNPGYTNDSPSLPSRGTLYKDLPSNNVKKLIVLYDYDARKQDEITIFKGEVLQLVEQDEEWYLASSLDEKKTGYIPKNYVAELNHLHSNESFADMEQILQIATQQPQPVFETASLQHNSNVLHATSQSPPPPANENLEITNVTDTADEWDINQSDVSSADEWEIDQNNVTTTEQLAESEFGDVWKGVWNGTEVAIKALKPGVVSLDAFLAEAKAMKKLRHKNLVQLYTVVATEPIYVVTEFMCNGSLLYYLRNGEGRNSIFSDHVNIAAQVAAGMAYIEQNNYIHRDVRAANILVGKNQICKVADFGLAGLIEDDEYNANRGKFPLKWASPESVWLKKFTIKSDVWSFGILLYEILTKGAVPYPGMSNHEVADKIEKGYRMQKPSTNPPFPDSVYDIMLQCWHASDVDRPTFEDLSNHFSIYAIISDPHP